jgi:hypothetical protein
MVTFSVVGVVKRTAVNGIGSATASGLRGAAFAEPRAQTGITQTSALRCEGLAGCRRRTKKEPRMNVVQSTGADDAEVERARRIGAYQNGRPDARNSVQERAMIQERDAAVRQAYDRGRRDERARRPRRHGVSLLTFLLVLVAAAGAFEIYLAVQQGGFANGGRVVDQNIANTTATATHATRSVADKAGDALENAGQSIKQKAGSGQ